MIRNMKNSRDVKVTKICKKYFIRLEKTILNGKKKKRNGCVQLRNNKNPESC